MELLGVMNVVVGSYSLIDVLSLFHSKLICIGLLDDKIRVEVEALSKLYVHST